MTCLIDAKHVCQCRFPSLSLSLFDNLSGDVVLIVRCMYRMAYWHAYVAVYFNTIPKPNGLHRKRSNLADNLLSLVGIQ